MVGFLFNTVPEEFRDSPPRGLSLAIKKVSEIFYVLDDLIYTVIGFS